MKTPIECKNIDEVRACIDQLDEEIISLLSKRYEYVKAVVPFKEKTAKAIIAEERREKVIQERRRLAKKNGLDPEVVEKMYRLLIEYFINEEMQLLKEE